MAVELSVAMIFKNEIRCLERCLKSMQPLKERMSCEIVMADTGSTDGSRAVAERYADVLFDFPWVDDFSAARNATLERCSGAWTLIADADEWLDADVDELVEFLRSGVAENYDGVFLTQRNYTSHALDIYADLTARRLLRMASGPRYEGSIHEKAAFEKGKNRSFMLMRTILHHDGYVMLNDGSEEGRRKLERNTKLLREELERQPRDLRRALQYVESTSQTEEENIRAIRSAVTLVEQRTEGWDNGGGAAILRHAVVGAYDHKLPELEEWMREAYALFPNSYFTRIDVNFTRFCYAYERKEQSEAMEAGEAFLRACDEYEADPRGRLESNISPLRNAHPYWKLYVRIYLAEVYQQCGAFDRALACLESPEYAFLDDRHTRYLLRRFKDCYIEGGFDVSAKVMAFWKTLFVDRPEDQKTLECREAFESEAAFYFDDEERAGPNEREAWEVFLPLKGTCALGDAAALMGCSSAEEADAILASVGEPGKLPAPAFFRALHLGANFPPPGKPLRMEQLSALALHLKRDRTALRSLALAAADEVGADMPGQDLLWTRALILAALWRFDWAGGERRMELARAFANVESAFLTRYYTPEALETMDVLEPEDRFGRLLADAFAALDAGDMLGYVRGLRAALEAMPQKKDMVSFLLEQAVSH